MENENPDTHIRDFEEVYKTFKEGATDMDLLKLKAFPLTLKDKSQIWLNSLRPRTIWNWVELGRTTGRVFEKVLQCTQDQQFEEANLYICSP